MNKYQISINRSNNAGRLAGVTDYNCLRASGENNSGISSPTESATERRRRAFFRHYEKHSKQLVDALKQWSNQLDFIDYEYADGELHRYNRTLIEPNIPFMGYMKKHLQSGAYGENFIDPNFIQSKRVTICDEIEKIMVKDFGGLPHEPSFNMLITNRIKTKCQLLVSTSNADSDSNNFYLQRLIHSKLFDVISGKRTLRLSTTIYENDVYQLVFENIQTIARSDESTIRTLKTVLESLVDDDYLCGRVRRYHELRAQLTPNVDYIELKRRVKRLHTCIHGGQLLGGFQSCDLCIPGSLADVE